MIMGWYGVTVTVLTAIGFAWAVVFVVDYGRLSKGRWRRTEIGILLMLGPASLGLMMGFILSAFVFGPSLPRQIIGVVLYSVLVSTLPWWHRVMRRSMKRRASEEDTQEMSMVEEST